MQRYYVSFLTFYISEAIRRAVLVMDDVLAALDVHTSKWIIDKW